MAFDKDAFLTALDSMSVMELNDLVKAIEEKFGVSAAAMAAPAAGGGGGGGAAAAEEKTEFTVVLAEAGANKVSVIKAVREITGLVCKVLQPHQTQIVQCFFGLLLLAQALQAQSKLDILKGGEPGEQRVLLEHRVDVALVRRNARHVGALEHHAASGWLLEASDHLQDGGLATAAGPQQRECTALRHAERYVAHRRVVAKTFGQMADVNEAHGLALRDRRAGQTEDGEGQQQQHQLHHRECRDIA